MIGNKEIYSFYSICFEKTFRNCDQTPYIFFPSRVILKQKDRGQSFFYALTHILVSHDHYNNTNQTLTHNIK